MDAYKNEMMVVMAAVEKKVDGKYYLFVCVLGTL
jgi:hypothetical protein